MGRKKIDKNYKKERLNLAKDSVRIKFGSRGINILRKKNLQENERQKEIIIFLVEGGFKQREIADLAKKSPELISYMLNKKEKPAERRPIFFDEDCVEEEEETESDLPNLISVPEKEEKKFETGIVNEENQRLELNNKSIEGPFEEAKLEESDFEKNLNLLTEEEALKPADGEGEAIEKSVVLPIKVVEEKKEEKKEKGEGKKNNELETAGEALEEKAPEPLPTFWRRFESMKKPPLLPTLATISTILAIILTSFTLLYHNREKDKSIAMNKALSDRLKEAIFGGDLAGNFQNAKVLDDSHQHSAETLAEHDSLKGAGTIDTQEELEGLLANGDIKKGSVDDIQIKADSHTHTGKTVSEIDVSADTNLKGDHGISVDNDTLNLGKLTRDWNQTGGYDIVLNDKDSELKILESNGSAYGTIDVGDISENSTYTVSGPSGDILTSTQFEEALNPTYVNVTGDTMTGNLNVLADLGIGTTSPNNQLSIIGSADISHRLGINTPNPSEALDVNGNILIAGGGTIDVRSAGTLLVGGSTQTGLTLGRSGAVTTISGLSLVVNPTAWTATPTISGLITATSGITANGLITGNADLVINGTSELNGDTTIVGATDITGDTSVLGTTNLTGPVNIVGATDIIGVTGITGTTTIVGATGITGATTITGLANINTSGTNATNVGNSTGILTLVSGGVSSWTNTAGNLNLSTATSGNINLNSAGALNLNTTSNSQINTGTGPTTLGGNLQVNGNATVSGTTTLNNTTTVNANTTLNGTTTTINSTASTTINSGATNVNSGTTTLASTLISLTGASPVLNNTSGTLYINSTNNNPVTFGSGLVTIPNLSATALATGNILPLADDTYDIGSPTLRYKDLYLGPTSLHISSNTIETTTARDWKLSIQETNGASEGNLRIMEGANEYMTLGTNGNVGINNVSPSYKLDIAGDLRTTAGTYLAVSAGNVGIGTATPTAKLDVRGNAAFSEGSFGVTSPTTISLDADSTVAIGGQSMSLITDGGQLKLQASTNMDIDAGTNITIDGINFTLTPTGTTNIDSTGSVTIDSDSTVTLGGAGVNIASNGGELDLTGNANIDINAGLDLTIDGRHFTLTPTGNYNLNVGQSLAVAAGAESSINTGANNLLVTSGNFNTTATGINNTAIGTTTRSTAAFTTLSANLGATISGGIINLNASSNFATNINTGTSTGTIAIGSGLNLISIDSSDWDISSTGGMTGISGIANDGAYTQSGTSANTFTGTATFSNATYSALFTGGNVGIGTATPTYKLDVTGTGRFTGALTVGGALTMTGDLLPSANDTYNLGSDTMRWANAWLGAETLHVGTADADEGEIGYTTATNVMTVQSNGNLALQASSGNVGIGTTAPSSKLQIFGGNINVSNGDYTGTGVISVTGQGQSIISGNLNVGNSTNGTVIGVIGKSGVSYSYMIDTTLGGYLQIKSNATGASPVAISSYGNVGIGTTSPLAKLNVQSGTINDVGLLIKGYTGQTADLLQIKDSSDVQRLTFNAAGNLGIGTTAPGTKLDVSGNLAFGPTNGRQSYYSDFYSVPTATQVNIALREGVISLESGWNYKIKLVTTGTATSSGAEYIISQDASGVWTSKLVSAKGYTANHPLLGISGTNAFVYHNHASTYSINTFVEGYYTANLTTTAADFFGLGASITSLAGNVGIGTTSPLAKLNVQSGTINDVGLLIKGYTGQTADLLQIKDSSDVQRLTFNAAGNLGIGTTAPGELLTVSKATGTASIVPATIRIASTNNASDWDIATPFTALDFYSADGSGAGAAVRGRIGLQQTEASGASPAMIFSTAPSGGLTEYMRLTTTGNLGIGITNPSQKLHVYSHSTETRIVVDGPSGQYRGLNFSTNNSVRWFLSGASSTAEGGGNAGSDFSLFRYDDTGTFLGNAVSVTRSTGDFNFNSNDVYFQNSTGNVGIGTTAPVNKLNISANDDKDTGPIIRLQGVAQNQFESGRVRFTEDQSNYLGAFMHYDGVGNVFNIGVHTAGDVLTASDTNAISIMRITGNVGIGTTNPAQKLGIDGNIGLTSNSVIGSGNGYGSNGSASYTTLELYNSLTGDTTLQNNFLNGDIFLLPGSSGDVGIGTTNPAGKLEVVSDVSAGMAAIKVKNISTTAGSTSGFYGLVSNGAAGFALYGDSAVTADSPYNVHLRAYQGSASLQFHSGNSATPQMLLSSGGNLGIGTTNPAQNLDVSPTNIGGNTSIQVANTDNTSAASMARLMATTGGSSSGDPFTLYTVTGQTNWSTGIDNSDSDKFKISRSAALGTTDYLTIDTSGNVGIGTTAPAQKLHVEGDVIIGADKQYIARYNTTDSYRGLFQWQGLQLGNNGKNYIVAGNTATGGNLGIVVNNSNDLSGNPAGHNGTEAISILSSGNVGIGTTAPAQKLHVEGHCITGDSLLSVIPADRVRRILDDGSWILEEQEQEQEQILKDLKNRSLITKKQIKDVVPGDYVYSLDEKTGQTTPNRINKLLDMGVQPVFELTTESGKKIQTTGNHPYFSILNNQTNGAVQIRGIEGLAKRSGLSPDDLSADKEFSQTRTLWTNRSDQKSLNLSSSQLNGGTGETTQERINSVLLQQSGQSLRNSNGSQDSSEAGLSQGGTTQNNYQQNSRNTQTTKRSDSLLEKAEWTKVIDLIEGDYIATVKDLRSNNKDQVVWEKISNIKYVGKKQVYDIEVKDTHNFIANEIFAHNTYISGNVGIGTTSPEVVPNRINLRVSGGGYGGAIAIDSEAVQNATGALWFNSGATPAFNLMTRTANDLAFGANNSEKMRITTGGNVGIGTTTPGARLDIQDAGAGLQYLTATTGTFSAYTRYSNTGGYTYIGKENSTGSAILSSGGTAYSFFIDQVSGDIQFATAHTPKVTILNAGNVGIGLTNPTEKLEVSGNAKLSGDLAVNGGDITSTTTLTINPTGNIYFQSSSYYINESGQLTVATDETINGIDINAGAISDVTSLTVDNVIIDGTTIGHTSDTDLLNLASGILTINGTADINGAVDQDVSVADYASNIYNSNATTGGGLYVRSDGTGNLLTLNNAGTDIVTITPTQTTFNNPVSMTSAGDVSMNYDLYFNNTTASYIKFQGNGYLQTESPIDNFNLYLTAANSGRVVTADQMTVQNTSNSVDAYQFLDTAGNSVVSVDTTNGRVGIGTTAPGAKLDVAGGVLATGGATFKYTSNIGSNNGLILGTVDKATTGTGGAGQILIASNDASNRFEGGMSLITDATTGSRRLEIGAVEQGVAWRNIVLNSGGGNVGIGTTAPGTYKLNIAGTGYLGASAWVYSSDERLKENISYFKDVPTTGSLSKILRLQPARYDYKVGEKNQIGFIAQDVQKVIPEAAVVTDATTGILGLKTDFIIPYLVGATQEQNIEVQRIATEVASQKLEVESLTVEMDNTKLQVEGIGTRLATIEASNTAQETTLQELERRLAELEEGSLMMVDGSSTEEEIFSPSAEGEYPEGGRGLETDGIIDPSASSSDSSAPPLDEGRKIDGITALSISEQLQGEVIANLNVENLTVIENVIVAGDIKVEGHIIAGEDTAGELTIDPEIYETQKDPVTGLDILDEAGQPVYKLDETGQKIPVLYKKVEFKRPYGAVPIINLTPIGEVGLDPEFRYAITEKSATGFTVKINRAFSTSVKFDWQVLGR